MQPRWWPDSVQIGEIVYPPGGTFGPRVQQDYQLVMLHTGSLDLMVDERQHGFGPGTVLLLRPGGREVFRFAAHEPTWHSWVAVHCRAMPDPLLAAMRSLPFAIPLSERMQRLTDEIKQWHATPGEHAAAIVESLAHYGLHLFLAEGARESEADRTRRHAAVAIAQRWIRQHLNEPLKLAELAQAASVSPEHLCRLFHEECGLTPMAYLWRTRVQKGLVMLAATGLSVTQIAEQCGFKSPFHFSRRVKQATGLSPTAYRRRRWAGREVPPPGPQAAGGSTGRPGGAPGAA